MRSHVSKLGPIGESGMSLYWLNGPKGPPLPVQANNDEEGLRKLVAEAGLPQDWTCDPELKKVARKFGLKPTTPPRESDLFRLWLEVGVEPDEEDPARYGRAMTALSLCCAHFAKATGWATQVSRSFWLNDSNGTALYTAVAMANDERFGVGMRSTKGEMLGIWLQSEPASLADAMGRLTGAPFAPLITRATSANGEADLPIRVEDVEVLCGALDAFSQVTPRRLAVDGKLPDGTVVKLEPKSGEEHAAEPRVPAELEEYDPDVAPSPEAWLAMTDDDRLGQVMLGLEAELEEFEDPTARMLHPSFHLLAETELAHKTPKAVKAYEKELKRSGDRHSAVHAVAELAAKELYGALKPKVAAQAEIESSTAEPMVDFTGVGRNDPCPCGSGKKFKRCHLDRQ